MLGKADKLKFNIVANDGETSSVSVFIGRENFTALPDHPNFGRLVQYLRTATEPDPTYVRDLLDVSIALTKNFTVLSERVSIRAGQVYFDGDKQDGSIVNAIVNFYQQGNENFAPLVQFMEKISLNPMEHSREQLFDYLSKHNFAICQDGDFIAYKKVWGKRSDQEGSFLSDHKGDGIVNGVEFTNSHLPNQPGTVVEMARSKVVHDPNNACSYGLHVANWRFAKSFSGDVMLRIKVNPRDVVSVPRDSSNEKMRVCRYLVLGEAEIEDRTALFVAPDKLAKYVPPAPKPEPEPEATPAAEKPKRNRKPKPAPKPEPATIKYPRYYEQFTKEHFESLDMAELRFVYKEFEGKVPAPRTKADLIKALLRLAKARLKTW